MNKEKLYAIYTRVSTDDQNDAQQISYIKQYAKRYGYKVRTYNDFNVSGKIPIKERPDGKRLINDIKKGKIQGLIVSKWDRITREPRHGYDFIDLWEEYKFHWLSIYEGEYDGSPDREFHFHLNCLLSKRELKQSAWRRDIGIARAKKEGKYKGRKKGSKNKK